MKLERSSWAGRTMLVVFFFALILSCGVGDVHAAVNSSAKTSASTGKGSTSKVKKGLIWERVVIAIMSIINLSGIHGRSSKVNITGSVKMA